MVHERILRVSWSLKGGVRCQFVKARSSTCSQNCYWACILVVIHDFLRYIDEYYRYIKSISLYIYITCSSYAVYVSISRIYLFT